MKRFLVPLFALCYLASAIVAQAGFLINPYSVAAAGGPATPTLSFIACTDQAAALTTFSYAGASIGTASATRTVIVVVVAEDNTADFTTASMTIGGVTANEQVDSTATARTTSASIYSLGVASGTTATIAVTFSEAVNNGATICVYAAYDLTSATATATAHADSTNTLTLSSNISADGVGVGGCITGTTGNTFTWTGFTEQAEADNGDWDRSTASIASASASTPLAITCADATSTTNVGVAATFR